MPVDTRERSDGTSRGAVALTASPDMAALMERVERTVEQVIGRAIDRVVDQVAERLAERLERMERSGRSKLVPGLPPQAHTPTIPTRTHVDKAQVLKRIQEMKAAGLSLQVSPIGSTPRVCRRSAVKGDGRKALSGIYSPSGRLMNYTTI
jgi:hypothetical protein